MKNKTKIELSKENLQKFNIHYLRIIARNIGVKSPTSLKKDCLIDNILKIGTGKEKPYLKKLGKPPMLNFDKLNSLDTNNLPIDSLVLIKDYCKNLYLEIEKLLTFLDKNI